MRSLAQYPVQLFRRLIDRIRAWRARDQARLPFVKPYALTFPSYGPQIHRDVTPHGVIVYSLCGECGSRLHASATLCEECAQKRRPARPY
jgi:hypothetical protein